MSVLNFDMIIIAVCLQIGSCETFAHANISMLLSQLESFADYAVREEIFDSLESPEHVHTLLQVMNETLPSIKTHVSYH